MPFPGIGRTTTQTWRCVLLTVTLMPSRRTVRASRCPPDRRRQHRFQLAVDEIHQVQGRAAVLRGQELAGGVERVQQAQVAVDEQRGRPVLAQQQLAALRDPGILGRPARNRHARPRLERQPAPKVRRDAHVAQLAVQLPARVDDAELLGQRRRGLARPQDQRAVGLEREMEGGQRLALHGRRQIDEDVAAADDVEARERRVAQHVVVREHDVAAQVGRHLEAVAVRPEVRLAQRRRHPRGALGRVDPGAGDVQRRAMHVGREHAEQRHAVARPELLRDRHGVAVRLFAGRAARDPDPELLLRPERLDQPGQHVPAQPIERLLVAEEARDADEQIAVERPQLRRIGGDAVQVLAQIAGAREQQPALDAAADRAALVTGEVDPRLAPQQLEDARQHVRVGVRHLVQAAVVLEVALQRRPHRLGRQHQIDGAGVDGGPGHAVELGGLVLGDDQATHFMDPADPTRPVAARPRQHDADGARARVIRQRAEEDVDGQEQPLARIALGQPQLAVFDHHLVPGRHEVDVIGLEAHPVLGADHRERRVRGQQLPHHALEIGRQVLDHHEGEAACRAGVLEQFLERLQAARRGADPDHEGWAIRLVVSWGGGPAHDALVFRLPSRSCSEQIRFRTTTGKGWTVMRSPTVRR
jgi:hypothetical protein